MIGSLPFRIGFRVWSRGVWRGNRRLQCPTDWRRCSGISGGRKLGLRRRFRSGRWQVLASFCSLNSTTLCRIGSASSWWPTKKPHNKISNRDHFLVFPPYSSWAAQSPSQSSQETPADQYTPSQPPWWNPPHPATPQGNMDPGADTDATPLSHNYWSAPPPSDLYNWYGNTPPPWASRISPCCWDWSYWNSTASSDPTSITPACLSQFLPSRKASSGLSVASWWWRCDLLGCWQFPSNKQYAIDRTAHNRASVHSNSTLENASCTLRSFGSRIRVSSDIPPC